MGIERGKTKIGQMDMIQDLLLRLDKVKSVGGGRFVACCSAHEDKTPSLSLAQLSDGRILIHCFAGCAPIDILNAVGMEMIDLFPKGCLGEFRGWEQLKKRKQQTVVQKLKDTVDHERMILAMATKMRTDGLRLTKQDLEREKQAYIEVHNYEHNNG